VTAISSLAMGAAGRRSHPATGAARVDAAAEAIEDAPDADAAGGDAMDVEAETLGDGGWAHPTTSAATRIASPATCPARAMRCRVAIGCGRAS
jgi:hypothetical protein